MQMTTLNDQYQAYMEGTLRKQSMQNVYLASKKKKNHLSDFKTSCIHYTVYSSINPRLN